MQTLAATSILRGNLVCQSESKMIEEMSGLHTQDTGRVIFIWDWLLLTSFPAVARKGLLKCLRSEETEETTVRISLFHLAATTSVSSIFPLLRTHIDVWQAAAARNGRRTAGSSEIPFPVTHRPSLAWASLESQRMLWSL